MLEYIRNCEETINIARFAYTLARLEPGQNATDEAKEKYRDFSHDMYKWIKKEKDRKELIAAIYIYAYSVRESKEE